LHWPPAVIVGAFVGHFYPKFGVEMKPLDDELDAEPEATGAGLDPAGYLKPT